MNRKSWLGTIPWAVLLMAVACSGAGSGPGTGNGGGFGSGAGSSGDTSSGSASSGAGSGISSGVGSTGATSGVGSTGAASGATSGAGGTGATSGAGGTGATSGAGGTGASAGASSGSSSSGAVVSNARHGKSAGCGTAPVGAVSTGFTNHKLMIATCSGCTAKMGNCPADCIAPEFAMGGVAYKANAGEDYNNRDFSIELPANYNPGTAYPVFYGGGGCGGSPPQNGDGFGVGETGTIKVGLQYVNGCFADGGTSCAGSVANEPLCVNGPELPYFQAASKWVESNFCVDLGNVFIGGYSSGGWEAFTLGCGAADLVRGFVSDEGGKREHRPPCKGPVAALMVAGLADTTNPIGPLAAIDTNLDSFGSGPGKDEVLMRNGCTGTATAPYDPAFPACVKYTGCPAAYPVVWCPLPGAGHNNSSYMGVNYSGASGPMWKFLSTLPPAP
jgi:hypothetical protein